MRVKNIIFHEPIFPRDLGRLRADRPLRTWEIHKSNDFYGQASVLKRYAGIPTAYPLKAVVEHGVCLSDAMWDHDRNAHLPMIFSSSEDRADTHRRLSKKISVPIGFGFLYAQRLFHKVTRKQTLDLTRRGTIAFPTHSTHTIRARFDQADYARRLANLPEEMQPVYVCMYWKNILNGDHKGYVECGLPIVTAGHIYDRDFLLRFYDICRRFRFAVSNKIGTHLFLSIASGCRFSYLDSSEVSWDVPKAEEKNTSSRNAQYLKVEQESLELFSERTHEITPPQRFFVEKLIGTEHMKTPTELRRIILAAEIRDKLFTAGRTDHVPPAIARRISRMMRIQRSIKKRLPWRSAA